MFESIVSCFELDREYVLNISATADSKIIGRLPSGGKPKTDVLVFVEYSDRPNSSFTISCKRTSRSEVSVHQYSADTFTNVLNPKDRELRRLLNEFQVNGNLKNFGVENSTALKNSLSPYLEKLSLWVLGGFGGDGNEQQCASYILTYDNQTNSFKIHTTVEYYHHLLNSGVNGHFGTLFKWTFASGQRGKSIQLKVKII